VARHLRGVRFIFLSLSWQPLGNRDGLSCCYPDVRERPWSHCRLALSMSYDAGSLFFAPAGRGIGISFLSCARHETCRLTKTPHLSSSARILLAGRTCVREESAVVREPAMDTYGRRAVEPGKERQLLEMIREAVWHHDRRCTRTRQRIANL
jgi:hypothetical protein